MRKLLFILLPFLMLTACASKDNPTVPSNNEEETQEQAQPENKEDKLTTTVKVSAEEFLQHFSYNIAFNSRAVTDYNQTPNKRTYTTEVTLIVNQLRSGFVTYQGMCSFYIKIDWTYDTVNSESVVVQAPKSTYFNVNMLAHDYETYFTYTQTYTATLLASASSTDVVKEIPYTGVGHEPTVSTVNISGSTIEATYYRNGISGDKSLQMQSYEITIANYSYYFNVGINNITTAQGSELFDYRVTFTINGNKYTVRRDGRYIFSTPLEQGFKVTNVEGYIDVYPGRVI